jgi:2-amino-4-hydroxy-6-hydroxymethyldihydropteridine diphosphokinase
VNPLRHEFILGLGSNLGDRAEHLRAAIHALGELPSTQVQAVSPAYDSDPVGYADQGNFLNLCLSVSSELSPAELLTQTLRIESDLGRVRTAERNGPRTLDIDLLFWSGGSWATGELTLPHPRWSSRGFVVIPLRNLLQHPALASHPAWTSLKAEVAALPIGANGLRLWQGPTPWTPLPP